MIPITKPEPSNSGPKYRSALALARELLVGFGVGVLVADGVTLGNGVRVLDAAVGVVDVAGEAVAPL